MDELLNAAIFVALAYDAYLYEKRLCGNGAVKSENNYLNALDDYRAIRKELHGY